jgi:O-acetylserine/cysteine efflux transporter
MQAQVFFTILFASAARLERPKLQTRLAMIIGFCGLALIALPAGGHVAVLGLCLTLGGAASWGISNVLIKQLPPVRMLNLMVWISIVPPLPLFLLSLIFEGPHAIAAALSGISLGGIGSVFYTAVLSTLVAYGVWGALIRKYSNMAVAPYALLVPIVGMAAAAIFLDRNLTTLDLAGAALTVAALAINAAGHIRHAWFSRRQRLLRPTP